MSCLTRKYNRFNRIISIVLALTFSSLVILPEAQACWWKGLPSARPEIEKHSDQSGFNDGKPNQKEAADPVFFHNGDFAYAKQDLFIPGRGLGLDISRTYKSQSRHNGRFGFGWEFNFNKRLSFLANGNIYYLDGEGGRHLYSYLDGTNYISPLHRFDKLASNPDGTFILTLKDNLKYLFNQKGWLIQIIDRNDSSIRFEYDSADELPVIGVGMYCKSLIPTVITYAPKLIRIIDTLNRQISLAYDERGRLKTITDFAGRVRTYNYNDVNDLISVITPPTPEYPQGLTTTYTYTPEHNMDTIIDPKNQVYLTNKYDADDRVIEQKYGEGTFYFSYDEQNNITTITDPKGFVTRWTYNSEGNPLKKEVFTEGLRLSDPTSYITTYSYDNRMQMVEITHPKGNRIKYAYDAKGNLIERREKKIDAPDANDPVNDIVTIFTYEPAYNFIKTIIDPSGNVTTYDYDAKGSLTKITYPAAGGITPQTTFTCNIYGQVETASNPNGIVTKYVYYPSTNPQVGYLWKIINDYGTEPANLNYTTEMSYDTVGNITSIKNARGDTTFFQYNNLNQLTQITSAAPFNYLTKYSHDENGNLKKVERQTNAAGTLWQTTEYVYTLLDQLETITNELGNVTTFDYDANGNRTSMQDAEGNTTTYAYDERDLLWKVTDALGNTTEYAYDENSNLKEIKDARLKKTAYTYDDFDRLETVTYQDAATEEYAYDKNSNLHTRTDQKNQTITYDYDNLNRLISKTYPDVSTIEYQYDAASRLIDVTDAIGTIHYDYDAVNRVKQVTSAGGKTTGYEYDALGNRTKLIYPDSTYITYEYDKLNRLTTVKDQTAASIASYTHDPLSRRTEADFANNTQATYQYDDIGRLLNLTNQTTALDLISSYGYTYDNVGNRLTMTVNDADTHTYTYDNTYQLVNVVYPNTLTGVTYNYDKTGNRTSTIDGGTTAYTTNSINQYTNVAGIDYTYDNNGNLTNDGVYSYSYDYENRLIQAGKTGMSATYTYDAFGRRIEKNVDGTITNYIYDGDQIICETDSVGTITAKYIYGPGIDEPIKGLSPQGTVPEWYYHFDGLGSVTNLTDSTGATVETYTYDVFGKPDAASTIGNHYMFTGREYDAETGLYYYRARYYSPSIGRFLQRDPVGYTAGINLYSYCSNNPINWVDPRGLDKQGLFWYDRLALWASLQTKQAQDLVSEGVTTNAWDILGRTVLCTLMEFGMGAVFYTPSAIGHLGEGTGEFIAKPSWETAPGMLMDISLTASILAVVGSQLNKPYNRYIGSDSNPTYDANGKVINKTWLTRDNYTTMADAKNKLQLPNMPTQVEKVKVPWYKYVGGPQNIRSTDNPKLGSGGGTQYRVGGLRD